MKDCKKYRIRPARSPQKHELLSGTVAVTTRKGKAYCYVHFEETFVTAVGLALPQGLSKDNPAYLKVVQTSEGIWRIFAMYLVQEKGVVLWESPEKPAWIGKLFTK